MPNLYGSVLSYATAHSLGTAYTLSSQVPSSLFAGSAGAKHRPVDSKSTLHAPREFCLENSTPIPHSTPSDSSIDLGYHGLFQLPAATVQDGAGPNHGPGSPEAALCMEPPHRSYAPACSKHAPVHADEERHSKHSHADLHASSVPVMSSDVRGDTQDKPGHKQGEVWKAQVKHTANTAQAPHTFDWPSHPRNKAVSMDLMILSSLKPSKKLQ